MVTQAYTISTVKNAAPPRVKMSQYDHDSRTIVFTVVNGSGSVMDLTGKSVNVEGTRADGHAFAVSCTVNGNSVSFTETADMTNQAGDHPAELVISNGSDRLGTMNFVISVEPCAMDENAEITEEDQSLFNQLYEKLATGSPATASTVAEMTNTDAVYLYTGSETGYTAGNWYYYDGTAWVSGGVYGGSNFDSDGTYPDLTAGQLYTEEGVENVEPYFFRAVPAAASEARMRKLVGGTVAWNQIIAVNASSKTQNGVTFTVDTENNKMHVSGTPTARTYNYITKTNAPNIQCSGNDIILIRNIGAVPTGVAFGGSFYEDSTYKAAVPNQKEAIVKAPATANRIVTGLVDVTASLVGTAVDFDYQCNAFNLTQMFGSTIADYIYSLEQATEGAGVAFFRKYFPESYYEYNAGELKSVEGVSAHETIGFNHFDKSIAVMGERFGTTGTTTVQNTTSRSEYIPVLANTKYYFSNVHGYSEMGAIYWYDVNKQYISFNYISGPAPKSGLFTSPSNAAFVGINFRTLDIDSVCINISLSGERNGEYEPYEKHSYPLDSSLTLRGVPKLDSNNNLYYDGDEYLADGTVTRKYGIVDLGTLNWKIASERYFQSSDLKGLFKRPETLSTVPNAISQIYEIISWGASAADKNFAFSTNATLISCTNSDYTDAATFKAAMSGVYLVYELATPTAETADPFTESQNVDPYGTEEFISTGLVPVGHDTLYVDDLKQRLEDIAPPTTDGTYTLQVTISGGKPTFSWVTANRSLSMGNPFASVTEDEPTEETEETTEENEEPVEEGDTR